MTFRDRNKFRAILISLILMISFSGVLSADELLSGSFWWETEPFVGGVDYPQTEDDAVKYLLDEARWVFSGMVYGFSLNYTPPDSASQVEQVFEMVPLGEIPWGDPALKVITGWREKERHFSDIGYTLSGVKLLRRRAWESNIHPQTSGRGSYTLYEGFGGRKKAVEDAVLHAVRGYYRQRLGTRPAEIHGEIALFDVPYIIISEGAYHARARILMDLEVTGQAAF